MKPNSMVIKELKFYENMQKRALECEKELTQREIIARNNAITMGPAMSIQEGWLWDICWNSAREYYLKSETQNTAEEHIPEED